MSGSSLKTKFTNKSYCIFQSNEPRKRKKVPTPSFKILDYNFRKTNPSASDKFNTYKDKYGRIIRGDIPGKKKKLKFHAIFPDYPFGVIRNHLENDQFETQHMPILQFWTWHTELHVAIRKIDPETESTGKTTSTGLCQCDIMDRKGDWCGSITLDEDLSIISIEGNNQKLFW